MAPVDGHRSSSGRSATTASTTEHQYNASNNTVNKFLGGRKPSWMTASNSVKPTPRPPNRPPKESLPELPLTQTNNLSTGSSQQPSSLSSSSLYRQHQRRGRPAKTAHPPSLAAAASAPLQLLPRPPLAHKTTQRSVV